MGSSARDAIVAESASSASPVFAAVSAVRLQAVADTGHARTWAQHATAITLTLHACANVLRSPQQPAPPLENCERAWDRPMDLNTIQKLESPTSAGEITAWREGDASSAGGTWLFSEPRPEFDTDRPRRFELALAEASSAGSGPCRDLPDREGRAFKGPPEWTAAPLLPECSHSLLMSFEIAHEATVGGNMSMSLPAGAMISLTTSSKRSTPLATRRRSPHGAGDLVTGNDRTCWRQANGSIHIKASALSKRFAFRRASLAHLAARRRSSSGRRTSRRANAAHHHHGDPRPVQIHFHRADGEALRRVIDKRIRQTAISTTYMDRPTTSIIQTYHLPTRSAQSWHCREQP